MMPGEGAVRNASTNAPFCSRQRRAEIRALGLDQRRIGVGDRADGLRQMRAVGHLVGRRDAALERALVLRIGVEIGVHRPRTDAAESGQAMAHVEHEGLARLLAVVDHVEAGLDLLWQRWRGSRRGLAPRSPPHRPASPLTRCAKSRVSAAGRGRLPAWVVRMRCSLRCIVRPCPLAFHFPATYRPARRTSANDPSAVTTSSSSAAVRPAA